MTDPNSFLLVDAHPPTLLAGTYEVSVKQILKRHGSGHNVNDRFTSRARFHVLGPRFALEPGWVAGRFPTPHSTGDHANVFPHVSLTRSTLPWERNAKDSGDSSAPVPWLAVLLLTESEMAADGPIPATTLHEVDAAMLLASAGGRGRPASLPAFPGLAPERGTVGSDRVRVLDVPRVRLEPLLPDVAALRLLTHVRERFVGRIPVDQVDALNLENPTASLRTELRRHGCPVGPQAKVAVQAEGREWTVTDRESGRTWYLELDPAEDAIKVADEARAVVVSGRATQPDEHYRAFLVSLEGRYRRPNTGDVAFDFGAATGNDLVRLVVLDTWTFEVDANAGKLDRLFLGLAYEDASSVPPSQPKSFTVSVPTAGRSGAGVNALAAGYAILPHHLRNGGSTRSWYRGPLLPAPLEVDPDPHAHQPVVSSEALVMVNNRYRMFDCSYAAAWELGRFLMLSNREVALDLVAWKRATRRHIHQYQNQNWPDHLPRAEAGDSPAIPSSVAAFAERSTLLEGVPFNYLIPDPAMVPPESLKCFVIDHGWVFHLLDGMLSLDRPHGDRLEEEKPLWIALWQAAYAHLSDGGASSLPLPPLSGLLIRSEVVAGWPDLHIEAYPTPPDQAGHHKGEPLHPLRRVRLSDNVLLLLVQGIIGSVVLHPNAEALHHTVPVSTAVSTPQLINQDGMIDLDALANSAQGPLHSGDLAYQLLKGGGPPRLEISFNAAT